jgi:hypothetical protein
MRTLIRNFFGAFGTFPFLEPAFLAGFFLAAFFDGRFLVAFLVVLRAGMLFHAPL